LAPSPLEGREAALERSRQLDILSAAVQERMNRYPSGMEPAVVEARRRHRAAMLRTLDATEAEWNDWRWQIANIVRDPDRMSALVALSASEREAILEAKSRCLPFAVT